MSNRIQGSHCGHPKDKERQTHFRLLQRYLGQNQLTGPIPEAIGQLNNLEYLYVNRPAEESPRSGLHPRYLFLNQLEGPIPEAIGQLTKIREL